MGIALLSSREPTASEFELRLHLKLGLHGVSARVSYCDRDVNVTMRMMHAAVGGCCIWQHEAHPPVPGAASGPGPGLRRTPMAGQARRKSAGIKPALRASSLCPLASSPRPPCRCQWPALWRQLPSRIGTSTSDSRPPGRPGPQECMFLPVRSASQLRVRRRCPGADVAGSVFQVRTQIWSR